jgi:poly-gamma-glutamate capsule biosynthesis protein CapA/YwtB (metallophosphatase superfamily)
MVSMNRGNVHLWDVDPQHPQGGRVVTRAVPLPYLDSVGRGAGRLWGQFVRVRNASCLSRPDPLSDELKPVPVGDALPNAAGDFIFDHGRGGGRMDQKWLRSPKYQIRYIEASHFGEVNTYYHLSLIAAYIDGLLRELGAPTLPRLIAVVNAHHAAVELTPGKRNGVSKGGKWLPFQGGHYRLPSRRSSICEHEPVSPNGEVHLGPGWRTITHGGLAELVQASGRRYRANASHNAGILYHEYGHHLVRHTADLRANALRPPHLQSNRKPALEEAICDYWAATMLGTPHIWCWHQRHDEEVVHPRSLVSPKTMAHFDPRPSADPHGNGTIFAAALWDLRRALSAAGEPGALLDKLVVQMLILLGRIGADALEPTQVVRVRDGFETALRCLLEADDRLHAGAHQSLIEAAFASRGITPSGLQVQIIRPRKVPNATLSQAEAAEKIARHVPVEDIPPTADLMTPQDLDAYLEETGCQSLSLVAAGDVMLGGRARPFLAQHGHDYPFAAILPLLSRSTIGLVNLEGPLASRAQRKDRNFSYRVNPETAHILARGGINVATLANNHLLDCGREGVRETLDALKAAGIHAIGAGVNQAAAHKPCIIEAGGLSIGLLGYYWNRRTAATARHPGSARDTLEELEADLRDLRPKVDRVVVTHHWGIPYTREPLAADRDKARFAIDCGADAVIGHHPHVVQPFEVYRGRPIFYSIGNFAFGSGNSRAESLVVALRFESQRTFVHVYAAYVKNRDPRAAYQPKVMRGESARRVLARLIASENMSDTSQNGDAARTDAATGPLSLGEDRAECSLPWAAIVAQPDLVRSTADG